MAVVCWFLLYKQYKAFSKQPQKLLAGIYKTVSSLHFPEQTSLLSLGPPITSAGWWSVVCGESLFVICHKTLWRCDSFIKSDWISAPPYGGSDVISNPNIHINANQ